MINTISANMRTEDLLTQRFQSEPPMFRFTIRDVLSRRFRDEVDLHNLATMSCG